MKFSELPALVLAEVLMYLSFTEVFGKVQRVCRSFWRLLKHSDKLVSEIFRNDLGLLRTIDINYQAAIKIIPFTPVPSTIAALFAPGLAAMNSATFSLSVFFFPMFRFLFY